MSIKKSLAGLIAGFALLGSIAAPAALADTGDSTTGSVDVTAGGQLAVTFCTETATSPGDFVLQQDTAPSYYAPGHASGSLYLCYLDTKADRPHFEVEVSATAFASGSNSIAASNFMVTTVYNVVNEHYDSHGPIGEIGFMDNDHWPNSQNPNPRTWTANRDFSVPRSVNFGYAGIGTGTSCGQVGVELVIPATTAPGHYVSNLTVSIVPTTEVP
jgi:hypothetical protein